MISIREVAKICGVSVATVHRAMSGGSIRQETKDKVLAVVEEYGYRPSPIVKETIYGKSDVVGYISPLGPPAYYVDFANALQHKLNEKGLHLFLAPSWDEESLCQSMDRFASRRVRAIIVNLPHAEALLPKAIVRDIPTVSVNLRSRQEGVYSVVPDFARCGADAAKYLTSMGHKDVLYVRECNELEHLQQLWQAFAAEMKKSKRSPLCFEIDYSDERWDEALSEVIAGNAQITATMTSSSQPVDILISVLARNGRKIPEDMSVLGGGGTPGMLPRLRKVTSYEYPLDDVTSNLLEWLENEAYEFRPCEFALSESGSVKKFIQDEA